MITNEKRAFKRVPCEFIVKYKSCNPDEPGSGTSVSENISHGGVYFVSLEEFKIGQLLDCCITMPASHLDGRWIARVVRCENIRNKMVEIFGVAAEFTKSFGNSEKILKENLSKFK